MACIAEIAYALHYYLIIPQQTVIRNRICANNNETCCAICTEIALFVPVRGVSLGTGFPTARAVIHIFPVRPLAQKNLNRTAYMV